jgi:hypothetical protein
MSEREHPSVVSLVTATAWAAAGLAAIALIGFAVAPSLRAIWLILVVLAVAAVPQALLHTWRERRKRLRQ